MKQGTISVLFGCHSIVHSFWVTLSWRKLYKGWPSLKELICILVHDTGHWGKDYLENLEQKRAHWELGAKMAGRLFGNKGYELCAGHCEYSGFPKSKLYKADKYASYIAPFWWQIMNTIFEPKLRMGYSHRKAVELFQAQVKESIESGEYRNTHEIYLERCIGN